MKKKIVVSGATGFIGGQVARRLHALGHFVIALGRDKDKLYQLAAEGLQTLHMDERERVRTEAFHHANAFVHCAALSSPWGKASAFDAANCELTRELMQLAKDCELERVVHFSSPSIYFQMRDQYAIAEAFTPPNEWITEYARSKWEAELIVQQLLQDVMPTVVLRPRAVFGIGDQAIFPRLIELAKRGRFPLIDEGSALVDVTYIDNVVDAVLLSLETPLATGIHTFNISNDEPMKVRDLLSSLFNQLGMQVTMKPMSREFAVNMAMLAESTAKLIPGQPEPPITRYKLGTIAFSQTLDISAAKAVLGYQPSVTVAEGIQRFAEHWRMHADA